MTLRSLRLVLLLALPWFAGCKNVRESFKWEPQPFVRVPAALPAGYDDVTNHTFHANGWTFRHVVACPVRTNHMPEAHWWMARPDDDRDLGLGRAGVWRLLLRGSAISHGTWRRLQSLAPEIADASFVAFGAYPQMVQPDLVFSTKAAQKDAEDNKTHRRQSPARTLAASQTNKLEVRELPVGGWAKGPSDAPPFDPLWHQAPNYSQLDEAKRRVRVANSNLAGGGIRIGILDTGYDYRHLLVPTNTIGTNGIPGSGRRGETLGDAIGTLYKAGEKHIETLPGDVKGPHGLKAMSILAGGAFPLVDTNRTPSVSPDLARRPVELGGAPDAIVVPARVAPWVFSHSTANLAYAIDYASRVRDCDVISMSHGGSPSPMWIDAVNAAYERGTAMFAACGDYKNVSWLELGIGAPSATVYPAACRRVVGVCGITANGEPYGRTDFAHYWTYYLNPLHWFPTRGSFGPDAGYRSLLHHSPADVMARADKAETRRGGIFRSLPIATWTPNIASAVPPDENDGKPNGLNLNWDGTSAATPQAASAAALWLALHRDEIESQHEWKNWRKAEAVYVAMLRSAGAAKPGAASEPIPRRIPDLYIGAGTLKAADMLSISYAEACRTAYTNLLEFPAGQPYGINHDFYDGQRSGAAILGYSREYPPYGQRADARVERDSVFTRAAERAAALETVFFNQMLVREWNDGNLPRVEPWRERIDPTDKPFPPKGFVGRLVSGPDEIELRAKSRRLAEAVRLPP